MIVRLFGFFALLCFGYISFTVTSCANMVPPTGGPKDSLPPQLIAASPQNKSLMVKTKTIQFQFDEYIDIEDAYNKITISPTPNTPPEVTKKLKTVTIKLKDSLESNTTYSIYVNGAIKDVNEGNKINDFEYVFSTGNTIDSNQLSGKVIMAETGKVDSTLVVLLHTNDNDSAIIKDKPKYVTKLKGDGTFLFKNLPNKEFSIFALQDEGGQKKYTNEQQVIAFNNQKVNAGKNEMDIQLNAFAQEKAVPKPAAERTDAKLRLGFSLSGNQQDILKSLLVTSNKKLIDFNSAKIYLTDTNFIKEKNQKITIDSLGKTITVEHPWQSLKKYKLIIEKDFATDEKKNTLVKNDTVSIEGKSEKAYGKLTIRLNEIDLSKNPVLIILQNDQPVNSIAIKAFKINIPMILPGEYELAILYDANANLKWDAGNYWKKRQPEIVKPINKKLTVKEDWDNELEIEEKL